MRAIFLTLFAAFGFVFSLNAQIVSNQKFFKTLPGVVPLEKEFLFIDETEMTNMNYREFLYWYKYRGDTMTYNLMLPDTTVWRSELGYNEPYVNYYLNHPAYGSYPVVGVSYEQAKEYCVWRTARVLEMLALIESDIDSLVYRLPTEKEWKKAARGTLPTCAMFPWEEDGIRKKGGKNRDRGLILGNVKRGENYLGGISNRLGDGAMITAPVGSYWPNSIGVYNMAGNVSEWVMEKKAMGSSWNDYPQKASLHYSPKVLSDTTTLSTLGFRCVMELISFKKALKNSPIVLTAKMVEGEMKYLRTDSLETGNRRLYASAYETTNHLYNTFLNETSGSDFLINENGWSVYTKYDHMKMYSWHPYYNSFPVVNITYESAIKYCEWLTVRYNSMDKKKFDNVVFRLPAKEEWEYAASAGSANNMYPWGGPYTRNSKAALLANFCILESRYLLDHLSKNRETYGYTYLYPDNDFTISREVDGIEYLGKKDAYFPNDLGLYNCAGNAAEMIQEKGVSKGGSWTSNQYSIKIEAQESYTRSNANLGFRVFMEVSE